MANVIRDTANIIQKLDYLNFMFPAIKKLRE